MDKIKIKVMRRTRDGAKEVFIDGYTTSDIPGLGVHRANNSKKWTITHLESGYSVMGWFPLLSSRRDAYLVAKGVARCGDWTKDIEDIKTDMEMKERVGKVYKVDFAYLNRG